MSAKCMQFFLWEECFYSCDPWAAYYENPQAPATLKNLPICSTMCDDWYEACKHEYTCVKDWFAFPMTPNGTYYCADNCTTFEETYGSGQEMCNTMWGESFFYSTNMDQCYSFYFWGNHNPNKIAAVGTGTSGAVGASGAGVGAVAASVAAAAVAALVALRR
jgi:folate receptor